MDLSTAYFCSCTAAEVKLLEDVAKEMPTKIKLKRIVTPYSMQINIETQDQNIRDYVYVVLNKYRERVKELEKLYKKGF